VTGASLLAGLVAADKLLLNEYLTITDVAVYSIALIFPQQIKKLFDIFDQFVTPSIYKAKSIAQAWNYLRYKFILISLIFFGIGFGGYFILQVLIPLFFSEQYVAAVPYTRWLWLTFSLSMPPLYLSNILKDQQKVRFGYVSSIGSPLTRFVFYIILLPLGIWGIVLATIVNYVSNGLFMIGSFFYYLRKERLEPVD
jgi:O-antigen/teichoic acid export membrane protein